MKIKLWNWIIQQGLGFVVLIVFVYRSEVRNTELERKIDDCRNKNMEALIKISEHNTESLDYLVKKASDNEPKRR